MEIGSSLLDLGPRLLHALQGPAQPPSQVVAGETARSAGAGRQVAAVANSTAADPATVDAAVAGGRQFPRGSFVDLKV